MPGTRHDLVFYDGTCGLCHRAVLFSLRRDPDGARFQYAPLGGGTFRASLPPAERQALPDSIVIRTEDGRTLVKSEAVIRLAERVGGVWSLMARVASLLPRWLLDWGYDGVAAVRRRLFRAPPDACPTLPGELRRRFLD